jgi:fatty acid desaturase
MVLTFYYMTHFVTFSSILPTIIFASLFGMSEALFAIHVMHDACHAAVSHNPAVWKYIGASFDILTGCSFFAWVHQHVIGHHLYTNIRGADPDIGEFEMDFRRVSPAQKWQWFYQYQHIYAPMLYGLLSIKYRLQDWQSFVMAANGQIRVLAPGSFHTTTFVIGKILFIIMRMIVPLFFMTPERLTLLFFVSELTCGFYLAFVFQVSHIAHGLDFYSSPLQPNPAAVINEDWAELQVRTTQDYAHGSRITSYLTGALNYQVVHHLFPTISQDHYVDIAPILKQVCIEQGIRYQILPTFYEAFTSHISYLKKMGEKPTTQEPAPPSPTKRIKEA